MLPSRLAMAMLCGAGALIAAACASTAPQNELAGTRWRVVTLVGQTVTTHAPTLEFAGDSIAGSGGCNRYFGSYSIAGDTIGFTGMGATRMACEIPIMQRESAYLEALAATRTFRRLGDTLVLMGARGETVMLRPE